MKNRFWKVGDVEIFQIVEVDNVGSAIQSAIPLATPENIKQISWLYPHFAYESDNLKSFNQSFIIKSRENNIVVDTADGEGKIRSDAPEWSNLHTNFLEDFISTGINLNEVNIVVSTHMHMDHLGFNTILANGKFVPTFPNAKYLFIKDDYEYWKSKPEKEMAGDKEAFADSVAPIVDAGLSEIVTSHYKIDENVSIIPLPGHTPGHVGIVVVSHGGKAIFSGDVIHHPCQIAHPEWRMLADVDSDMAFKTRKKLLDDIADTNTLLFGTHFANPVAGKVVRSGSSFEFKV